MSQIVLRIESPHWVAGMVWDTHGSAHRCVRCAPILRWAMGLTFEQVLNEVEKRKWKYSCSAVT